MGGISVWQLLILLVIVLVIFGTKRLRNAGSDLGGAIKGFREGMAGKEDKEEKPSEQLSADQLDSADSVQERAVVDPKDEK